MVKLVVAIISFVARREVTFEVATFGGSLLLAFVNTCEIYRYYRRLATLGGGRRHFGNLTVRVVCLLFF